MTVPYIFADASQSIPLAELDANFAAVSNTDGIEYTAPFSNSVSESLTSKLSQIISVKDFGAVGDGSHDDTQAFKNAINAAQGGAVFVPFGKYLITSNLDAGITSEIRLIGENNAFSSHTLINSSYTYSNDFSLNCIANYSTLGDRFSVIVCNGCNMIGSDDTTQTNQSNLVRQISNLCIIGTNNAKIGLYINPEDTLIENCSIALFKNFGICVRGGITSTFRNISFEDNGWGLSSSGSVSYPATYVSGCAFNIVSNFIVNDFATSVGGNAATTLSLESFYINVRGWMVQNLSGYLGIQVHLARGLNLDAIGSYTGHYFYICSGSANGIYVENYSYNGLTTSTQDPHCIYCHYSAMTFNTPTCTNNTVTSSNVFYFANDNQVWSSSSIVLNNGKSNVSYMGSVTSRLETDITVQTAGSAVTYNLFENFLSSSFGFCGFLIVEVFKNSDLTQYAYGCFFVQKHNSGLSGVSISPSISIASYNSSSGAYTFPITAGTFDSTGGIQFTVTWGSGYSNTESFHVNCALVGADTISAP
jgi:hypothetical protein